MRSRLSKGALLGVAAGIVGIVASSTLVGLNLEENLGLEILFHLRGERTPPSDVVVVSIDKESTDSLDLPDDLRHWPRSLHARLTETLAKGGAAVIAFDVFFEDPSEAGDDLVFAETIRKANNVLLCERLQVEKVSLTDHRGAPGGQIEITRRISPIPLLAGSSAASAPYPLPKVPVKVSRDWTFQTSLGDASRPTFPVVAFHMFSHPAYDDFLRLLEEVFPEQARRLSPSGGEKGRSGGGGGGGRERTGGF